VFARLHSYIETAIGAYDIKAYSNEATEDLGNAIVIVIVSDLLREVI